MTDTQCTTSREAGATARWLLVGALAVVATGLLVAAADGQSTPDADTGSGQTDSVIAVAGKLTDDTYGLYLVDTEQKTIVLYQYLPSVRRLKLMAGRTYAFDSRLDEYNTEPSPREIRKRVMDAKRLTDVEPPNQP